MVRQRSAVVAVLGCVVLTGALLLGGSGGAAVGDSASDSSSDSTGGAERGQLPRIRGNVGPGMEISVRPRRVEPGTYRFVVRDQSPLHNWHIRGPNDVNRKTGVSFVGTKRFTLELVEGRYRIRCDVHPTMMFTRLRVL